MGDSDVLGVKNKVQDASAISVPGTPWWVTVGFRAFAVLGIPGLMLSYYVYRDYKYEGLRIEVEKSRIAAQEKQNVLLERFEKVLWRVERKLPDGN